MGVTILILVDGFLQFQAIKISDYVSRVTILILVDGFLQYVDRKNKSDSIAGHNPYFSRWFSAMKQLNDALGYGKAVTILILVDGFLQ